MTSILEAAQADRRPPPPKPLPADTQQVCIDLPGEEIRCYIYKPKLQIMLRKHRDVIFDVQLFKGMAYTVEADQSDFYNARDKKIVLRQKQQKVTFQDGERLHLWVGRNFKGALILKANGRVLGRYAPGLLDPVRYDSDPRTKPAPLMVVMKNDAPAPEHTQEPPLVSNSEAFCPATWNLHPALNAYGIDNLTTHSRQRPSVPVAEQHATVAVVDGSAEGMPQKLLDFFASGGSNSGLADVDPNDVMTRNWLLSQLSGAAAYGGTNWNWLRHSIERRSDGTFRLVSAKVTYVRGNVRIYFSGFSKSNPVFGPGGHGPGHAKIMQIYAGIGQPSTMFKSTTQAVAGTFKGNALVSFFFSSATAYAEWQAHVQKDGYDFAAAILTGVVKTLLAVAIAAAAVAVILLVLMGIIKMAVVALAVGVMTLVAGFASGYLVEAGDKRLGKALVGPDNNDGTATLVAPWLRSAGQWVNDTWNYLRSRHPTHYQKEVPR